MKIVEIKLSGLGVLYHVHPIASLHYFSTDKLPSDMMKQGILLEPFEVPVITEVFLEVQMNGHPIECDFGSDIVDKGHFNDCLPVPFVSYMLDEVTINQIFIIRLNDDEVFVPDNLRFFRSDECPPFNIKGVIPSAISYDGQTITGESQQYYRLTKLEYPTEARVQLSPILSD